MSTKTPMIYEMLLLLLRKDARVVFVADNLRQKARRIVNVALDADHLKIFYELEAKQTQSWRKLSTSISLASIEEHEDALRLEQQGNDWILHSEQPPPSTRKTA